MTTVGKTSRRRRLPWWAWTLAALAAVIAVVSLLGGFRDVPESKLPIIALGEPFEAEDVTTTITSVRLSPNRPGTDLEAETGSQYLLVTAILENDGLVPSSNGRSLVRVVLDGAIGADTEVDSLREVRTNSQLTFLQPGLPVEVEYAWPIAKDAAAPGDSLIVGLLTRYPIPYDPVFGDTALTQPSAVARIVTTIGDSTEASRL